MNALPRQKLMELVGRFGQEVANDPRRCEALLRDLCPQFKLEISLLVTATKESVPAELLSSSTGMPKQALIARLTKRLHEHYGIQEGYAQWAVDSWALALGLVTIAEIAPDAGSHAVPSANAKWTVRPSGRDPRYDVALNGCDQAVLQMFSDVVVEWEGKALTIPAIYGTQEDAVAYVLQEGEGADGKVARVHLPLVAVWSSRCCENPGRHRTHLDAAGQGYSRDDGTLPTVAVDVHYSIWAWTMHGSDIEQISAQIMKKLEGGALVQEAGVPWRTAVKLCTVANNLASNGKPTGSPPIYKYQFDLIAETFLCLPRRSPRASRSKQSRQPRGRQQAGSAGKRPTSRFPTVAFTEILLEPQRYVGQSVWLKGVYESVDLHQKCFWLRVAEGHIIEVYYSALPREQQAIVVNERRADGHPVLVEGRLEEVEGSFSGFVVHASQVMIKGLTPKRGSGGRSAADIDWDGSGPCPSCATVINMKFDDAVCPICGHRMNYQEAFQACGSYSGSLPRNVFSEKDLEDEDDNSNCPVQSNQATVTNSMAESVVAAPFQRTPDVGPELAHSASSAVSSTSSPVRAVCADWITEQSLSDTVWNMACPRIEELKARFTTRAPALPKQIENIRAACAIPPDEPILALIDVTIRKNGMNGICFTPKGIYWHYKFLGIGLGRGFLGYDQVVQETFDPKGSDEIVTRGGVITMSTYSQARDPTIVLLRILRDRIANADSRNTATDRPAASSSPSPALWYYVKQGQQQGPVTIETLRALAATGQLQPSDLVWQEGMNQWVQAGSVDGLCPQADPTCGQTAEAPQSERVRHKCPACGRGLKLGANAAGRRLPCPGCEVLLEVSHDLRLITRAEDAVHPALIFCPNCNGVLLPQEGGSPQQCALCGWSAKRQQDSRQAGGQTKSATVRHKCPACGRGLKVGANVAGRQIPCPACNVLLQISADLQQLTVCLSDLPDLDDEIMLIDPSE